MNPLSLTLSALTESNERAAECPIVRENIEAAFACADAVAEAMSPPDICKQCATSAGTPWPAGATGIWVGPCTWCSSGDRALLPFDDLETTDFEEEKHHA